MENGKRKPKQMKRACRWMPRLFNTKGLMWVSLFVGGTLTMMGTKAEQLVDVRSATVFQVSWENIWANSPVKISYAGYQEGMLTPKQEKTISTGAAPWAQGYHLTLRNLTTERIRPVVEYLLFAKDSAGGLWRFVGLLPLQAVAVNGVVAFKTYKPAFGYGRAPNGTSLYPETMLGVWIRIYDETGTLRQEWAYPWSLMTTQKWVDEKGKT